MNPPVPLILDDVERAVDEIITRVGKTVVRLAARPGQAGRTGQRFVCACGEGSIGQAADPHGVVAGKRPSATSNWSRRSSSRSSIACSATCPNSTTCPPCGCAAAQRRSARVLLQARRVPQQRACATALHQQQLHACGARRLRAGLQRRSADGVPVGRRAVQPVLQPGHVPGTDQAPARKRSPARVGGAGQPESAVHGQRCGGARGISSTWFVEHPRYTTHAVLHAEARRRTTADYMIGLLCQQPDTRRRHAADRHRRLGDAIVHASPAAPRAQRGLSQSALAGTAASKSVMRP